MRSRYRKLKIDGKTVNEHRYIMEQILGRPLEPNEVVHHINGNKFDNRPENLMVMKASDHSRMENLGRTYSEETKAKVSASLVGNKRRKGIPHSEEVKARIANSMKIARASQPWSTKKK